jgi:hypothetical protein
MSLPPSLSLTSARSSPLSREFHGEVPDRQWRDILGIFRVQGPRLDRPYLDADAPRLDVEDLLARALREGRLTPEHADAGQQRCAATPACRFTRAMCAIAHLY